MPSDALLDFVSKNAIEFIDLRYSLVGPTNPRGTWRHVTVPARTLTPDVLDCGIPLTGVRGAGAAGMPRIALRPDARTVHLDPFAQHPTAAVACDIIDADNGSACPLDARSVARLALAHLGSVSGLTRVVFTPDVQFFVFDRVSYAVRPNQASYCVESREGAWQSGRDEPDNLGTQLPMLLGEDVLPPFDSLVNLRAEMVTVMESCGVEVRGHRHGPATAGQAEIQLAGGDVLEIADALMLAKHVIRNVAARHGKVATFMPQPLAFEVGSGMQTHIGLYSGKKQIAVTPKGRKLPDTLSWAIGGLHAHAHSLMAFTCPTVNSHKRLLPNRQTPRLLAGDSQLGFADPGSNPLMRSAADGPTLQAMDASCNPYLAFSATLMALTDGIEEQSEPVSVADDFEDELPTDAEITYISLERDSEYLEAGGVFARELIEKYGGYGQNELDQLIMMPHPLEFSMYFGA